jgi:uncharacterized protein YdhG (YjbR/CyaY superfamily)
MTHEEYFAALAEPRQGELRALHALIRESAPDLEPTMEFGTPGYGRYHYRYASGREGDAYLLALSPRKNYISLYVLCTTDGAYLAESYKERLPKASIGKSCVRFKRPSDIDLGELRELLAEAVRLGPPHQADTP